MASRSPGTNFFKKALTTFNSDACALADQNRNLSISGMPRTLHPLLYESYFDLKNAASAAIATLPSELATSFVSEYSNYITWVNALITWGVQTVIPMGGPHVPRFALFIGFAEHKMKDLTEYMTFTKHTGTQDMDGEEEDSE